MFTGAGDVCEELWQAVPCAGSTQGLSAGAYQDYRAQKRPPTDCTGENPQSYTGMVF